MARSAIQVLTTPQDRLLEASKQIAIAVGASLVVALCAHITIPLMPLTPVPLTVQNLGVLLVGLMLGSRRGFAALALYLAEGAVGLPVFSTSALGLHGVAQILGPTGGFLMVYPLVAFLAGYIFERGMKSFLRAAVAGLLAEILLFAGGLTWLFIFTHSLAKAAYLGLYWFLAAEVIKVMLAAGIANRWRGQAARNSEQH
ncbi:MAG TPA: biotin transporter BioY [Candidatus Sulfotelmatobacter sp.]|nr:biotin transporter BioY [Candidatus Sulfotelmatobacter sp.]